LLVLFPLVLLPILSKSAILSTSVVLFSLDGRPSPPTAVFAAYNRNDIQRFQTLVKNRRPTSV